MINLKPKANNPAYAVSCFFQGVQLLGKSELRKYLLIPILINLVLYSSALYFGYSYISELVSQFIPTWLSWLEWLIWPLFFVCFLAIGFFTFTLLANLMAAPFYSQLSAKTWSLLSGERNAVIDQNIAKAVWAEVKRMGYIFSRMIPLLIISIIPGINLIAPFLWALFGAWCMGLEFMAYPQENKGILFSQQKQQAKTKRMSVLSFGGFVIAGLSIPIVNLIVAPAAVIGATIYFYGVSDEKV